MKPSLVVSALVLAVGWFNSVSGATCAAACVAGSLTPMCCASTCVPSDVVCGNDGECGSSTCTGAQLCCMRFGALVCLDKYSDGAVFNECPLGCPAGRYVGSGACVLCPAGSYCPGGEFAKSVLCTPGTCSFSLGAKACTQCAVNFFSASEGAKSCEACAVGMCTHSVESQTCVRCNPRCVPGEAHTGELLSGACYECRVGFYSSTDDALVCRECTCVPGRFCLAASRDPGGIACPGGHSCFGGPSSPALCPPGTIALGGASSCTLCEINHYSASAGSVFCDPCAPGTCAPAGAASCGACGTACVPGQVHAGGVLSGVCTECAPGTFSSTNDALACSPCTAVPGRFCPAGSTSAGGISCPAGHACSGGTSSPAQCAAGNFAPADSSSCSGCEINYFSGSAGAVSCAPCPVGSCAPLGATSCGACGTTCVPGEAHAGGVITGVCTPCAVGTFSSANDALSCSPCTAAPGTFCAIGSTSAGGISCPGGHACSGVASAPAQCAAGTFAPAGSSSCAPCQINYVSGSAGAASCDPCAVGTCAPAGSASCSACGSTHDTCVPGQAHAGGVLSGVCTQCAPGTFSSTNDALACSPCTAVPGVFCPAGSTSPGGSSCPRGHACSGGTSAPAPCAAGNFAPAGSSSCSKCEINYFSGSAGAVSCDPCPVGSCAPLGATSCGACGTTCVPGEAHAGGVITGVCTPCAVGTFSSANDALSCSPCSGAQVRTLRKPGTLVEPYIEFPQMGVLSFVRPNGVAGFCSGQFVSPKVILTAASCVWTAGAYNSGFQFKQGQLAGKPAPTTRTWIMDTGAASVRAPKAYRDACTAARCDATATVKHGFAFLRVAGTNSASPFFTIRAVNAANAAGGMCMRAIGYPAMIGTASNTDAVDKRGIIAATVTAPGELKMRYNSLGAGATGGAWIATDGTVVGINALTYAADGVTGSPVFSDATIRLFNCVRDKCADTTL